MYIAISRQCKAVLFAVKFHVQSGPKETTHLLFLSSVLQCVPAKLVLSDFESHNSLDYY